MSVLVFVNAMQGRRRAVSQLVMPVMVQTGSALVWEQMMVVVAVSSLFVLAVGVLLVMLSTGVVILAKQVVLTVMFLEV
jgi:hypothetical protein